MNYIKHTAIKFTKTIRLHNRNINLKNLSAAVSKRNFAVRKYSTSETLLIAFGLYDEAHDSDALSFIDENGIGHIFIDDSMPEQKQLFALAHELGHIQLKHDPQKQGKRQFEREANLFAHYLLDSDYDIKRLFSTIKILIAILCLLFSIVFCLLCYGVFLPKSNSEQPTQHNQVPSQSSAPSNNTSTVFYYTPNGEVYHIYRDCQYIRNSDVVHTTTTKVEGIERICSACEKRSNE